jgi:tetratricopeptide (TPR) repeat protein
MKALKLWKDNISATYKRLPAFTQIYTETVVLQCEMATEDISEEERELLEESKKLIGKAIIKRPYAKFYSTRGRIYCCDKNYDEGINEVRKAIEIEDSKREDYFTRINEYQSLISRFQSIKDKKALKEEAKQIREEMKKNTENFQQLMDKSKIDYISILGFFSAVMALIIGSTDIIKGQITMIDSLLLLMGFAGMIVISFGCLNMLLVRKEETRTNKYPEWLLLVIGGGMIVASLLMKVLYYYLKNIILI